MHAINLTSFRQVPRFVDAQQNISDDPVEYQHEAGSNYTVPARHWIVVDAGPSGGVSIMSNDAFTALYEADVNYVVQEAYDQTQAAMTLEINRLQLEARARAENCTALASQMADVQLRLQTLETASEGSRERLQTQLLPVSQTELIVSLRAMRHLASAYVARCGGHSDGSDDEAIATAAALLKRVGGL